MRVSWSSLSIYSSRCLRVRLAGVYQILSNPLVDRAVYALRAPWYLGGLRVKSTATARALLHQLPSGQRKALEMAFFDGLTHREIAEMTGQPVAAVKSSLRSALLALREAFQP